MINEADSRIERVVTLAIYVAPHCANCAYALTVAEQIRRDYPAVQIQIVDMSTTEESIPEDVFATPTYLLDGRVWSLGNPSNQQIRETFAGLLPERR